MSGSSDSPHTLAMAQFVAGLRYEDIPAEVVTRIKLLILDSLGCALYGSYLKWSRILRSTLAAVDTSKGCRVWSTSERLSAPRGSEKSFASEADIVRKFKLLATHVVSEAKADTIVNLVLGAERLARADEIAGALANG